MSRVQSRSMSIHLSNAIAAAAALVVAITFAACGGSGGRQSAPGTDTHTRAGAGTGADLSGDNIAQVGQYQITKAMLNEWMEDLIGEEYYRVISQPAPAHLAMDPPDFPACVSSLRTIAPNSATESELTSKCESLYLSMRKQTLEYLVSMFWQTNYARTRGLVVNETEAKRGLAIYREREYPHDVDFKRFLVSRRRTISQELFLIKGDLLQQKLLQKVTGLGHQAAAAFTAEIGREKYRVHCRAGYLVEHCAGFRKPSSTDAIPPSAQLFEEIARWRSAQ
jgi:hypothetical protein